MIRGRKAQAVLHAVPAGRKPQKTFGGDHTIVATDLNNIAWVLKAQGNLDEALRMHRQALDIKRGVFGEDHLSMALSLSNIGSVLMATIRLSCWFGHCICRRPSLVI